MPDEDPQPPHVHYWSRDRQPCSCGAPVPSYLTAAWDRFAEKNTDK